MCTMENRCSGSMESPASSGCCEYSRECAKFICDDWKNTGSGVRSFVFLLMTCLFYYTNCLLSILKKRRRRRCRRDSGVDLKCVGVLLTYVCVRANAFTNEFDGNNEPNVHSLNLDQIAAVFNKVAYGSTTKRSIPETAAYPVTTLVTPLLTTYKYTDGYDEWMRVDTKRPEIKDDNDKDGNYGMDLEKDHALPTSAPAADILKNNNNKNYNNPNRYNNDRLKPDRNVLPETVTETVTTTWNNFQRNVRPTKSMYTKEVPNYVPPQRDLFTPPLPPKFLNPFQDKPTLRGTNNDFVHRRPIPPPSLMPNKDRIPFRPDLPKVNSERIPEPVKPEMRNIEKKKTLNTPSQNVRINDGYGNRNVNESNFEYDKGYLPAITRILSGPNGRNDDFPDLLLQSVSSTPKKLQPTVVVQVEQRSTASISSSSTVSSTTESAPQHHRHFEQDDPMPPESVTVQKNAAPPQNAKPPDVLTTQISDVFNLKNVKQHRNVTYFVTSEEIWLICWNVHVYLVVIAYIFLALFSIYKLIRYENEPHMFSKNYFLTIHLMLTTICVLRIFYLIYDAYNVNNSFNVFLYDFLHNFPLSLMATTFAILILFLLKRTLTHLEVKTRPVFLVVFAVLHIVLCFVLSVLETFGQIEKAGLIVCKPVFVLLAWALGVSYLYLYRIIKKVLAKKSQNMSEMCTQNISYASHITIAVALLFVLLGFVQLYALFAIETDKFNGKIKNHWILWGFELSVRFIEISIITLLAIVVSLKMSQREKQCNSAAGAGGFPLFPCTTSDSSTDNIYPNNCNTNPNAMNYTRNEMMLDNLQNVESGERALDKTLEKWRNNELAPSFERNAVQNASNSSRKTNYETKYYTKPKYDEDLFAERNIYSEPVDNGGAAALHEYERTRHEFEFDRRSRTSSGRNSLSGRKTSSTTSSSMGRSRKNHARPHLGGIQTLPPNHDNNKMHNHHHHPNIPDSMLVDEQGFVRFRHMQEMQQAQQQEMMMHAERPKKNKKFNDFNQYGDV